MKKTISLLLLLLISFNAFAQDKTHWVFIGEGTFEDGFTFPYKIKFSVPWGYRSISDIKEGLVPMRFDLDWLLIKASENKVKKIFKTQIENSYADKEIIELSQNIINYFLRTLPKIKKHDEWTFIYYPDEGSKLFIDEKKVHHLVGAELNRALVQSWLNQSPMLTANLFNRLLKLQ